MVLEISLITHESVKKRAAYQEFVVLTEDGKMSPHLEFVPFRIVDTSQLIFTSFPFHLVNALAESVQGLHLKHFAKTCL